MRLCPVPDHLAVSWPCHDLRNALADWLFKSTRRKPVTFMPPFAEKLSIVSAKPCKHHYGSASFIEAKDNGSGSDSWSCKSCKAPVISSPPKTNTQHSTLLLVPGLGARTVIPRRDGIAQRRRFRIVGHICTGLLIIKLSRPICGCLSPINSAPYGQPPLMINILNEHDPATALAHFSLALIVC